MQAIEVQNLIVQFSDFIAVDDISFQVPQGEIFGFLGANGAGKTTTIRVLCGLLTPSSGSVRVAGIGFEHGEKAIKSKVGYMSQKFTLYDDLSVEENLNFLASLRKMDKKSYLTRRSHILEFISFQRPLNSLVKDLPGGMKQQIALAAAILHDPDIVFLDEPTAGVTPASRARFWSLLRLLAKAKKTIFVTTHYMDEAEQCDRVALMATGKIIALDSPENLKNQSFPTGIYELTPLIKNSFTNLEHLRHNPLLEFLEPYGTRFHASVPNSSEGLNLIESLKKDFQVIAKHPSLEDVFIRLVESKTR